MKRLSISAGLVAALIVVGGVLWRRVHFEARVKTSRTSSEVATPTMPRRSALPDVTQDVQDEGKTSGHPDATAIRQAIEAGNVAIDFWGKVVDQDGNPLQEVQISYTYSIHHGNDQGVAWIGQESRKGEARSDGNGLFAITGLKGHDLTLESFSKPGYINRMRFALTYNFRGDTAEGKFKSRPDRPVRVTMIQKTSTEPLIHIKGGLRVNGDGVTGRWDLWSGEPNPNGELAVTLRREPAVLERSGHVVTWSADLEIVGGGIIEAPWEEDVHRAPESGYSITVAYPKEQQKEGVPRRSFYVRTADSKYGRIQVELYADDDGPTARCFVTCDMNPRPGSRNLEPAEEE